MNMHGTAVVHARHAIIDNWLTMFLREVSIDGEVEQLSEMWKYDADLCEVNEIEKDSEKGGDVGNNQNVKSDSWNIVVSKENVMSTSR